MNWNLVLEVAIKAVSAVIIGGIIGSERARHGRAAGMRTHILVCLGAALTAMIGVHSGIGFLGLGMIIIKNNNVVSGLKTAAGIWATSIVGIALGYGFYIGAVIVALLMLLSMVLLARFERAKRRTEAVYVEVDDMSKANEVIDKIIELIGKKCPTKIYSAKSGNTNNIGIIVLLDRTMNFDFYKILEIPHVLYVDED